MVRAADVNPPDGFDTERWRIITQEFVRRGLRAPGPAVRLPDPKEPKQPFRTAILLRGICSWHDDETFRDLEFKLPNKQIKVIRYSYNGPDKPQYEHLDTIQSLTTLCGHLRDHVQDISPSQRPFFIAHSFGGNVVANFICSPDFPSTQAKPLIFLLASPVRPPFPSIRIFHPTLQQDVDYRLKRYNTEGLTQRADVVVIRCTAGDPISPKQTAWIGDPGTPGGPLEDKQVPAKHLDICNHKEAVQTILAYLFPTFSQRSATPTFP